MISRVKNKRGILLGIVISTALFMLVFRLNIRTENLLVPLVQNEVTGCFKDKTESDWCRVRRERVDWVQMIKPCKKNMSWWQKNWNKFERTDSGKSIIISKDIRAVGEYSKFYIQSRTPDGRNKLNGGDSWRVKIKGKAWISPTVFDLDNGQYEVIFRPMEPGQYNAEIFLDYSLCDGLRDPPNDWFIRGNAQGKHQPEGILGELDDYLLQPFQEGRKIEFAVPACVFSSPPDFNGHKCKPCACGNANEQLPCSCKFIWDGYGSWRNSTWRPIIPGSIVQPHTRDLTKGKGTLWSYGDSLNYNLYRYNFVPSQLCRKLFQQCRYNINFVYHIKYRIELDTTETDNLDFNATRVVEHFRNVLLAPDVNHVNSVIFLNLGLHYVMSLTFEKYQDFIQKIIGIIAKAEVNQHDERVPKFKGHVIWKTTSAINKQKATSLQATKWRFCTYPRVKLFNAYATSAMCKAGIEVVDMFPITDSYPQGTYDVVHYHPPASQPLVPLLEEHLRDSKS